MNIQLIRILQFFWQFSKLKIRHKPGKKHIVSDALSWLASTNTNLSSLNLEYFELNTLFMYSTTLVDIYSDLINIIIDDYKTNK